MPPIYKAMASGSSQATLPNTKLGVKDVSVLYEALYPVRAKYKFFGLQIGVNLDEIKNIETNYKDSEDCLLEVLSSRLKQEPALTCADIDKALRSRTINECQLANDFQSNHECKSITNQQKGIIERESSMTKKAAKSKESDNSLKMSEKESERMKRTDYVESDSESDNDIYKAGKYTEVERQVHERDKPKSKRAKKRARKKEKAAKNKSSIEQPEPDECKEDGRKQMKVKQKQKTQFSKMAASTQSGAEPDQKRKKSVKESETISLEIMSTDSENESSDACKEKEIPLSKSEKTGKVRESAAYSEVKHQPQSKNELRNVLEKEESTRSQHSVLNRKIAVSVESDEDTSEQPSHKSKKKLKAEETESEETSDEHESEPESLEHREEVTLKSLIHTEIYHNSVEEMEKEVRAKANKGMPQKSKVAVAKCYQHFEIPDKEDLQKQKKGERSFAIKEQGRESELLANASRGRLQKPKVQETDSGIKAKRPVNHSTDQASDKSETDSENEESDSGNDSSEDGEDSEEKSPDEEEETETEEDPYTAPSEEEVKMKMREEYEKDKSKKRGFREGRKFKGKRVSKAAVVPPKYGSLQPIDEACTRKVKGNRVSKAASLKYDSPGDDEQSDPDHCSKDQEEHDIQQKRRNKKKKIIEISMGPTAIGRSSPSTSQEEKRKQPVSKKQGHRKKHVRKMKEKRERMKREKVKASCSSDTDDSSPECDMTKNQYKGEMKELVNIFEQFFGKLCCAVFDPRDVAAELQSVGLISKSMMREMILSPESQQAKIIALVDELDKMIRSRPDRLFVIIKVMLKNEALQETTRDILRQAGIYEIIIV